MMLTIRKEQVKALEGGMARQFELKMIDHLRQKFPSETEKKEDEELVAEIRQGVKTSGKYGISAECDVARYIEYMMMYGLSFDTDPKWDWAGKILRTDGISGVEKLDRVDTRDQFLRKPA
jgi:hypothetical protein